MSREKTIHRQTKETTIELTQQERLPDWPEGADFAEVGTPRTRLEGHEKVTGRARYSSDVRLPGQLYAAVLRSSVPHARVVSVDTSAAEALPGVHAVICAANTPDIDWFEDGKLFSDTVRFAGEEIAAVAADSEEIAHDALPRKGLPRRLPQFEPVPREGADVEPEEKAVKAGCEREVHPRIVGERIDVDGAVQISEDIRLPSLKRQKLGVGIPDDHQVKIPDFRRGVALRVELSVCAPCASGKKTDDCKDKCEGDRSLHLFPILPVSLRSMFSSILPEDAAKQRLKKSAGTRRGSPPVPALSDFREPDERPKAAFSP